jgi:hypothetical protein
MKIKQIIQLSASLLITCGFVRTAEWIDPIMSSASGDEVSKIETTIHCSMPCGSSQH